MANICVKTLVLFVKDLQTSEFSGFVMTFLSEQNARKLLVKGTSFAQNRICCPLNVDAILTQFAKESVHFSWGPDQAMVKMIIYIFLVSVPPVPAQRFVPL